MPLITTIILSSLIMCTIAIPAVFLIYKYKDKFKKPAISCRKFKRREKFHQHGQEAFKHKDESKNDKS